jgi:hypothetical protein
MPLEGAHCIPGRLLVVRPESLTRPPPGPTWSSTPGPGSGDSARCSGPRWDGSTYLPDHEPAPGARRFPGAPDSASGFDLAAGVDLLIHDAQYTAAEYGERVGWGHRSLPQAFGFAAIARVKQLVTFHHDPGHDDLFLDRLMSQVRRLSEIPFELIPGTEGATFHLD